MIFVRQHSPHLTGHVMSTPEILSEDIEDLQTIGFDRPCKDPVGATVDLFHVQIIPYISNGFVHNRHRTASSSVPHVH